MSSDYLYLIILLVNEILSSLFFFPGVLVWLLIYCKYFIMVMMKCTYILFFSLGIEYHICERVLHLYEKEPELLQFWPAIRLDRELY